MMRKLCVLVVLILVVNEVHSQDLVFSQPIKLGSQINSDDEELGALVSADGNTMYFSRAFHAYNEGGKFAGTDIWVSKKDANGQWLPAANMGSKWNNKRSNSVIGINKDNTVVYLLNAYSNRSGISFSKFYGGEWQVPEFIPIPGINRDDFVGFYANPTFDVVMISMKGKDSFGEEDLYVSLKDSFGNWTEPKNLGATINSKGFEISPFLTEDKKRLFFSSNGHGGYGDADIFYCDRLYDSWETWTVPRNPGAQVNSIGFDAYFATSSDTIGFFTSNRQGQSSDLFSVVIERSKTEETFIASKITFLNDAEVNKLLQMKFMSIYVYESKSIDLNETQLKEFVKLSRQLEKIPNLRIHMIARRDASTPDLELSKQRLLNLLQILKDSGIEGSRITFGSEIGKTDSEDKVNSVYLRFHY